MEKQVDCVVGQIRAIYEDRNAAWEAYFRSEYRLDELQDEISRLKEEIRRLKSGCKKPR